MSLRDFKIPKMKFKKMKMDVMEELKEIDYEKIFKITYITLMLIIFLQ